MTHLAPATPTPPKPVVVDVQILQQAGFTATGIQRYETSLSDYSGELFSRSVAFGEAGRARGLPLEVTHDHVRAAATAIAGTGARHPRNPWSVVGQVGEYLLALATGAATNHLDKPVGIGVFIGAAALGVILVTVRLSQRGNDR